MDAKRTFLNGFIEEEFFVKQRSSFKDVSKPNHIFKLEKGFVWA